MKNTFITLQAADAFAMRRLSVPASLRLCSPTKHRMYHDSVCKISDPQPDSETSTGVCTECSDDSDYSGDNEDSFCSLAHDVPPAPFTPAMLFTRPVIPKPAVRLRSAAPAFKPRALLEDAASHQYDLHFSQIVKDAVKTIRDSQLTCDVNLSDSLLDCAIVVQPWDNSLPTEHILNLTYRALLHASSKSSFIFLMGYLARMSLDTCPLGFEATLGVMERATSACWHLFKKGFCRHEDACRKQHPSCTMSIRILVERCQSISKTPAICDFNLKVAGFVSNVALVVERAASCARVEAVNRSSKGWTIELTPEETGTLKGDYVLALAKHAFLSHSCEDHGLYMLGYAAKPFISRPNGFVVVLGNVAAEKRLCWDFYSKGFCRKGCDCKWEHPTCSTPINITLA